MIANVIATRAMGVVFEASNPQNERHEPVIAFVSRMRIKMRRVATLRPWL